MSQEYFINKLFKILQPLVLITTVISPGSQAAEIVKGKILIINSDSNVEKYRQVENEFRHELLNNPVQIIGTSFDKISQPDALEKLIRDENPDLIYSIGSKAYQRADQAKASQPLVFSSVINWQRFVQQSNTHGIANELSLSQELSLMRYLLPDALKVGVIFDPQFTQERIAEARASAKELGITLIEKQISQTDSIETAVENLLPSIDLLWLIADPGVLRDKATIEQIFSLSEQQRKPIYTYSDAYLSYGASLVVVADIPTIGRQVATLVESILRHEPVSQSVQPPAGSHIILNQCQLAKIKVGYNQDALDSVNQIIECH